MWRRILLTLVALLAFYIGMNTFVFYKAQDFTRQVVTREREDELRRELFILRRAIEEFKANEKNTPQTLEDLERAGYLVRVSSGGLRKVPVDPITEKQDWRVETSSSGIVNVHSNSLAISSEGTPYSMW